MYDLTHDIPVKVSKFTILICLWFLSQLFVYKYMSRVFSLEIGVTITFDRLIFIILLAYFFILVSEGTIELAPLGKIEILMLAYAIYITTSLWISGTDLGLENYRWLPTIFNSAYCPFIIYFIAKSRGFNRKELVAILTTLAIIGLYLALTGIFEHYKIRGLVWPGYIMDPGIGTQWGRSRGPFVSSGTMGRVLILTFLITVLLINYSNPVKKKVLIFNLLLITVAIYFTSTRSPWLAFALSLMILVLFRTPMRRTALIVIIAVALGIAIGVGSKMSFWESSLFSERTQTISYRVVNYYTNIEMIKDNPLFGIGYGNFENMWEQYLSDKVAAKVTTHDIYKLKDGNHNTFLGLFAELGIVGFGLYLLIFWYILQECIGIYKRLYEEQVNKNSLIVVSMAMMAVYFVVGQFVDLRFQQLQPNIMFLFFGLVGNLAIREKNEKEAYSKGAK